MADMASDYDRFRVVKIQQHCPIDRARLLIAKAKEVWADLSPDLLDGIKVRTPEGWFIVRPSNTEPFLRLVMEADGEEKLALRRRQLESILGRPIA